MSFVIQNMTGQPDDEVYVLTFGKNSGGDAGYLDIDTMTGKGTFTVASSTTESESFSVLYSDLPVLDAHSRYIQIPQPFESARMYFSIKYPLILAIGVDSMTGDPTIVDPDSSTPQDPNTNTLYDKVEYTYNPDPGSPIKTNLFINPTAVDFFSLPISIRVSDPIPSGQVPLSGLNFARSDVNAHIQEVFNRFDLTSDKIWSDLYINFLEDPDNANSEVIATLRVSSPNKSTKFPLDYLDNSQTYGFSYVDNIWNFYMESGNQLRINAIEIASKFGPGAGTPDYYKFTGTVIDANTMQYVNDTNDYTWNMQKPVGDKSTQPFFGGAGFMDDGEANDTPGAIIVRQFTSAFAVGIMPRSFSGENFMDADFFKSQIPNYYTNNPGWGLAGSENGPFYDLYSKSIHSLGNQIYTFAYDDELSQDGTLTGNTESPQDSFPIVTLYTVDNEIPDPFDDPTTDYTVKFMTAANNPVGYRQGTSDPFTTVSPGQVVSPITSNATDVFQLELKNPQTSNTEIITVYLKYKVVIPGATNFATALGTTIVKTGDKEFTVTTPGLP